VPGRDPWVTFRHRCRRGWGRTAQALLDADLGWLGGLVSRRVPLADFTEAFEARDDDVKV
jgi:hypothetical protein